MSAGLKKASRNAFPPLGFVRPGNTYRRAMSCARHARSAASEPAGGPAGRPADRFGGRVERADRGRHRAVPAPRRARAAAGSNEARGRHRAGSAPTNARRPVVAGVAVVAVAAAGAIALADVEGDDPLGIGESVALSGPAALAPTSSGPTADARSTTAAAAPHDALAAAARGRARDLLATRIAAVEQQATAAAATQLTALRRECKFNPRIQRLPAWDPSQVQNAQTIIGVAQQMGLPVRAEVIALATAWQESNLINMSGGDRDSVGLFQQRPSMGWGSYSQVHNPLYATEQFYDALTAVPGWETMPLTVVAQTVQQSAFGWAYARWEQFADNLVAQLTDDSSATDLNCTPQ
jgi:hypothetical protein